MAYIRSVIVGPFGRRGRVGGYLAERRAGGSAVLVAVDFALSRGERKDTTATLGGAATATLGDALGNGGAVAAVGSGRRLLRIRRAALVAVPRAGKGPAGAGFRSSCIKSLMAAAALSSEDVAGRLYLVGKSSIVLTGRTWRVFVTKTL